MVFNPERNGNVCLYISLLDVTSSWFRSLATCLKFTLRNVTAKTGNRRKPGFKDSDMESENFSLLIRLSVSDGQTTDCSKDVSLLRYIIKTGTVVPKVIP